MYSAAVYNYFNNARHTKKPRCGRRLPIPKPCKTKKLNKCKLCGRKFVKIQNKHEVDSEIQKQPENFVFEKVLLIWKYAKNLLSSTVQRNASQKCSFKVMAHKSYKKRSLHHEIVSTSTSVLPQICKICEKHKIQKNKCKELKTREYKMNEQVLNEEKHNITESGKKEKRKPRKKRLIRNKIQHNKLGNKKSLSKDLLISNDCNKSNEEVQWKDRLRGKKRPTLKRQKRNCIKNLAKTTALKKETGTKKIEKKNQNPKKVCLPKKKYNTNKNKRMFLKDNRKKVNRIASWQYMQHALSSVGEGNVTKHVNEDKTPVYLTFEEYCLILEAIDTQSSVEVTNTTDSYTRLLNIITEDVGTNTDLTIENTEDASTNTEQLFGFTEQVAINTEQVSESTEQTNIITEKLPGTTEEFDINNEPVSETTATLDAINDPLSEATEEFDVNTDQPSDTIIHIEINNKKPNKDTEKLNITIGQIEHYATLDRPDEISKQIDENSLQSSNRTKDTKGKNINNIRKDINEIGQTDFKTLNKIEKTNDEGNQSNEQTELTKDSLDNQDKTVENTSSENKADGNDFVEN